MSVRIDWTALTDDEVFAALKEAPSRVAGPWMIGDVASNRVLVSGRVLVWVASTGEGGSWAYSIQNEQWRGEYPTRDAAMAAADAELLRRNYRLARGVKGGT